MNGRILIGVRRCGAMLALVLAAVALSATSPAHAQLALDGFDDVDGPVGWTAGTGVSPTSTATPTGTITPTFSPCINMTTTETCTPTVTPPSTNTPVSTNTRVNTRTRTPTNTHPPHTPKPGSENTCHIAAPAESARAWWLVGPVALVLLRRRLRLKATQAPRGRDR